MQNHLWLVVLEKKKGKEIKKKKMGGWSGLGWGGRVYPQKPHIIIFAIVIIKWCCFQPILRLNLVLER